MSGAAWSSCGTRWKTCVGRASCARCWHRVSTWTRMTSRYCTGPDCTDYPLADFLPFIESPPFKTRSSAPGFFYWQKVAWRRFLRARLERDPPAGYAPRAKSVVFAREQRACWELGRCRRHFVPRLRKARRDRRHFVPAPRGAPAQLPRDPRAPRRRWSPYSAGRGSPWCPPSRARFQPACPVGRRA